MFEDIKRIFFDSGMVLIYPKSGEWFFPIQYKEYCKMKSLPEKSVYQYLNFRIAYNQLSSIKYIKDEDQEFEAFSRFYKNVFKNIKGKDNSELIELCTFASVKDYAKYSFYDDVEESIKKLNCKYELGIISDAWPSLKSAYRKNRMEKYFEPFIISSMYGCTKQGYDLFKFALANVAQKPEECLFIDDSHDNCKRAKRMGMQVLVLNRNKYHKQKKDIWHVNNMKEVENLLGIY
jgi:putative hydrolase of the HAD superfamily